MKTLRAMFVRFAGLFRRKRHEAEMNEELRAHLDALAERNLAAGMSREDASNAAHRVFGGIAQITERARDERRSAWGEHLLQDLRYAVRQLRKTPGFTAVAVLSLALGIGANTAIYSIISERLLKPLAVRNPDELVLFQWLPGVRGGTATHIGSEIGPNDIDASTGQRLWRVFSLQVFERLRAEGTMLTDVMASAPLSIVVAIDGRAEHLGGLGQMVSGDYFNGLGVPALLGRTIQPADDRPAADPVAVISHRYWRERFGSDPAVLGKIIRVNNVSLTVVGVTPPDFHGTMLSGGTTDLSVPLALLTRVHPDGAAMAKPGYWFLRILGRMKPGVTREQALAAHEGAFQASAREGLSLPDDAPRLRVAPGGRRYGEEVQRSDGKSLLILMGLVGLVLLAACANLANLLLARGAARRREIAVRLALGASRGRIVSQLLTECLVLALAGAGLGGLMAAWGANLLGWGVDAAAVIDWRVLGFNGAVTLVTVIAFGLAPALRATRVDLRSEFHGGAGTRHGGGSRPGQVLVIVQVALSLVLLVGAGLFARTLHNLHRVDVGFNRERLVLFGIEPRQAGYRRAQFPALHDRLTERIAALPGVRAVTICGAAVLSGSTLFTMNFVVTDRGPVGAQNENVTTNSVAPNFFETLELPIVRGRGFTPQDTATAPKVAVINESLAKKFFGNDDPIGRRFNGRIEIVGVMRDAHYTDLRRATPPAFFVPLAQEPDWGANYVVRTNGESGAMMAAIRRAVGETEPNLPLARLRTQEEEINRRLRGERLLARMSGFFGLLALGLACVGLYGLMSYAVVRRTAEIGIRMALGALPRRVLWMIVRESLSLVVLGIALGIGGAMAAVRLVTHQLYGLSPTDPATYGAVALLLIAVALVAALLPARRAAKIDPMAALRSE